eukprot:3933692-Rhodomonas_salina.4
MHAWYQHTRRQYRIWQYKCVPAYSTSVPHMAVQMRSSIPCVSTGYRSTSASRHTPHQYAHHIAGA